MADLNNKLVVAISSRALFDLSASHAVYQNDGVEAFSCYQRAHEDDQLEPGVAFALVKKLLALNNAGQERVEVILLSRNSADTGLRVFNSIRAYGLSISRAVFSGGASPYRYAAALGAHLFLSAEAEDVKHALEAGVAAATILPSSMPIAQGEQSQLRLAFDGDAVLFSDEAERIYKQQGLEAFAQSEVEAAHRPLEGGPFRPFLAALAQLQAAFSVENAPIRTALVTARGAPAHERVIRTLRAWNIRLDEALFLGGLDKGPLLEAFGADIFFDDQTRHCDSARQHVATGHVPHGVANE